MKKLKRLLVLSLVLSLFSFINLTYAVSNSTKTKMDQLMFVVEKQWSSDTIFVQLDRYEKAVKAFENVKVDGNQKEMIDYLLVLFRQKIRDLNSQIHTQVDVVPHVDRDEVETQWLFWHNQERGIKGLHPYKINPALKYSALKWAQQLAKESRKSNTHTRNAGDGYYNYNSILKWFNDLGISFDYNTTAFTENVAYQRYTCKSSDCTQEIISALKKGFDFFMKEKSYNGVHYRAITSDYFDQLGFGVATNGNYYRVVTHYGINVN